MFERKNLWRGGAYLCAALVFVGSTAGTALETNRNMVDGFLGTKSYVVQTDTSDGELYTTFTADYANTDELVAAHQAAGETLAEEGSVLLKNNGALPLAETARKVTLLGLRADAKTIYGATVGVSVPDAQNVSLTTALTERGFSVNTTANEAYAAVAAGDAYKGVNKLSPSFSGVLVGEEPVYTILEQRPGQHHGYSGQHCRHQSLQGIPEYRQRGPNLSPEAGRTRIDQQGAQQGNEP